MATFERLGKPGTNSNLQVRWACKMSGNWEYFLHLIFLSSLPAYEYLMLWLVYEWVINTSTHREQNWENVCFHGFCLTTVLLGTEQNSRCMEELPMRCSSCKSHGKFSFEYYLSFHGWLVVVSGHFSVLMDRAYKQIALMQQVIFFSSS